MTFFECFGDFLQKIGNFCDLGTVTHQFWSHRYLLPSRKCRKYLWLRNLRPTVPKSQLFPTFVMKSQVLTTISKKGSQFLWLRNRQHYLGYICTIHVYLGNISVSNLNIGQLVNGSSTGSIWLMQQCAVFLELQDIHITQQISRQE